MSYISTHTRAHTYIQSFVGFFTPLNWLANLDVSEGWVLFTVKCAVTNACDRGLVAQHRAPGAICAFPRIFLVLMWSLSLVKFCQLHISWWDRVYAYCVPKRFCYHCRSTLLVSTSSIRGSGEGLLPDKNKWLKWQTSVVRYYFRIHIWKSDSWWVKCLAVIWCINPVWRFLKICLSFAL